MSFINDSFMLKNETAKRLYAAVKDLPIIDYHCHLSPKMIEENYQFRNAFDLFLGGDHYKWRQMRTNGIDESLITGDGDEYEKFKAFAKTMPYLIGNPLYHWTHLELKRYFDIGSGPQLAPPSPVCLTSRFRSTSSLGMSGVRIRRWPLMWREYASVSQS